MATLLAAPATLFAAHEKKTKIKLGRKRERETNRKREMGNRERKRDTI